MTVDKSIIITGCAGFIGINFLKHFIENRLYEPYMCIYLIDKMGYATTYNKKIYDGLCFKLKQVCPYKKIVRYDCSVEEFSKKMTFYPFEKIDILNFASESHVDKSIHNPSELFIENSQIPLFLLKMCPETSCINKFYHISTDEVYGDLPLHSKYDNTQFKTTSQFKPSNPYSASKVAQDAYLISMRHTFGVPVRFIRMANQFGCHQHKEKMIPNSLFRVFNKEPITVYGNGDNCRQWTYVDITVKIIGDIISEKLVFDDVIHIADTRNLISNNELVHILKNLLEVKNFNPSIEYIQDRIGHDRLYALEVEDRIQKYFDDIDFINAIETTIDYYINWYKHDFTN